MISSSGVSDPLTLGREENFLSNQVPLRGPPLPRKVWQWWGGGDGTFLQLTENLFFLSAYVRFRILFSPESVIIIWQRKWRIFINWLTKDVLLSHTFFYTKWSISYHYKVVWLLTKIDKLIFTPHPWKKNQLKSQVNSNISLKIVSTYGLWLNKEESVDTEWW